MNNLSLLYVEDEESIRNSLELLLGDSVDKFYLAADGLEGLELYKTHKPDIVITDIEMPKMDGIEMVKKIKEINKNQAIFFISAHTHTDYFLQAIDLHVDGYLLKPIDFEVLEEKINIISQNIQLSKLYKRQQEINDAMLKIQGLYISGENDQKAFDMMLLEVLKLTESQYGFYDSLEVETDGTTFLQSLAITNIAWDDETRKFYDEYAPDGLKFYDFNALFGDAVKGEIVISNFDPDDKRRKGTPDGHPPLNTFTAIPLKYDGKVIGVMGLANRETGYTKELIDELNLVWLSCTHLVNGHKIKKEREERQKELKKLNSNLEKQEKEYRQIIEGLGSKHLIYKHYVDTGEFTLLTQSFETIFGIPVSEALGRDWRELIEWDEGEVAYSIEQDEKLYNGEADIAQYELKFKRQDGQEGVIAVTGFVLDDENGRAIYHGLAEDVSEMKKVYQELEEKNAELSQKEENYRTVFESSIDAIYIHEIETGRTVDMNDRAAQMYRTSKEDLLQEDISFFTGKSQEESIALLQRASNESINFETKSTRKDGSMFYEDVFMKQIYMKNKKYIHTVSRDVTQRKMLEMELQVKNLTLEKQERQYRHLIESIGSKFLIYQHTVDEGKFTYVTEGFETIFGIPTSEALHKDWPTLINWKDGEVEHAQKYDQMLADGVETEVQYEMKFVRPDNNDGIIFLTEYLSEDDSGKKVLQGIAEDVTKIRTLQAEIEKSHKELEEKNKQLEKLAITDQLTQLYNRKKLDESMDNELNRAKRFKHQFGVILLDIDHFKQVNDTHGHQVGDITLQEIAKILLNNTRSTDIVGRWGGEEFLIICPEAGLEGIMKFAENLRVKIESYDFPVIKSKTSSFGATVFKDGDDYKSMVARADEALYDAKSQGRNRVLSK